MTTATETDPNAPHGYAEDGITPLAPYGLKADGTPRKSAGGRPPSTARPAAAAPKKKAERKAPAGKRTDAEKRQMLIGLSDMLTMPLVGASRSPIVAKKIGEQHAMALAGDAVIAANFVPHFADGLIAMSQTKPGLLAFLDVIEERAGVLMLANTGAQLLKAIVSNHLNPDPRLANAGLTMAQMRSVQMAEEIERQAAAMGVPTGPVPVPEPEPAAA